MDDLDKELTLAYGLVGDLQNSIGIHLDNLVVEAQLAKDGFERGVMPNSKSFGDSANIISKLVFQYEHAKSRLETLKALKESIVKSGGIG